MDELKKTKVTSTLERLSNQTQAGMQELQALRADIARYEEEVLRRYADFKDAEEFLLEGRRKIADQAKDLEIREELVESELAKLAEDRRTLNSRFDQIAKQTQELNLGLADLHGRMEKTIKIQNECELERKRLSEASEGLVLREKRVSEREASWGRKWQTLTDLMNSNA